VSTSGSKASIIRSDSYVYLGHWLREIHYVDNSGIRRRDVVKRLLVGGFIDGKVRNASWRIAVTNGDCSSRARGDCDSCGKGARSIGIEGIFSDTNVPVSSVGLVTKVAVVGVRKHSLVGCGFPEVSTGNYSRGEIARVIVAGWRTSGNHHFRIKAR